MASKKPGHILIKTSSLNDVKLKHKHWKNKKTKLEKKLRKFQRTIEIFGTRTTSQNLFCIFQFDLNLRNLSTILILIRTLCLKLVYH